MFGAPLPSICDDVDLDDEARFLCDLVNFANCFTGTKSRVDYDELLALPAAERFQAALAEAKRQGTVPEGDAGSVYPPAGERRRGERPRDSELRAATACGAGASVHSDDRRRTDADCRARMGRKRRPRLGQRRRPGRWSCTKCPATISR